jgi:hypothetical protein
MQYKLNPYFVEISDIFDVRIWGLAGHGASSMSSRFIQYLLVNRISDVWSPWHPSSADSTLFMSFLKLISCGTLTRSVRNRGSAC